MRKLIALIAALAFTFALVGCSDDDDSEKDASDKKPSTTTTTETPALDPEDIDSEASPYCATWADIRGAGPLPSNDAEAVKKYYAQLVPKAEKLLTQAPSVIKASVEVALEATRKAASSGSLEDFDGEKVKDAQRKLADYAVANCQK
jgi:hypothetical protein